MRLTFPSAGPLKIMDIKPTDFDSYSTPILLCVFNRPDLTKLAIENLRTVKPKLLYIIADGPRPGNVSDDTNCKEVRNQIESIDWPCQVKTRFLESNMGCGLAVSGAIQWFFENEEEGIILEDDTLPVPYFFLFAQEMLTKFRHDERVFMVSGTNLYPKSTQDLNYFFTRYPSAWGWATWRRAWDLYDFEISKWVDPAGRNSVLEQIPGRVNRSYLSICFDEVVNSTVDTWDYQWIFSGLSRSALGITAGENLVTNIGVQGTHSNFQNRSHFLRTSDEFKTGSDRFSPTELEPHMAYERHLLFDRRLPIALKHRLRPLTNQIAKFCKYSFIRNKYVRSSEKQL